jgi:hypothetical protein
MFKELSCGSSNDLFKGVFDAIRDIRQQVGNEGVVQLGYGRNPNGGTDWFLSLNRNRNDDVRNADATAHDRQTPTNRRIGTLPETCS